MMRSCIAWYWATETLINNLVRTEEWEAEWVEWEEWVVCQAWKEWTWRKSSTRAGVDNFDRSVDSPFCLLRTTCSKLMEQMGGMGGGGGFGDDYDALDDEDDEGDEDGLDDLPELEQTS